MSEKNLNRLKNSFICLYYTFDKYDNIAIGRKSLLDFRIGIILAIFQLSGYTDFVKILLKMYVIYGNTNGRRLLTKTGCKLSKPMAFERILWKHSRTTNSLIQQKLKLLSQKSLSFKDVLSGPSIELCESLEGITGIFTNCLFSSSRFIAIFWLLLFLRPSPVSFIAFQVFLEPIAPLNLSLKNFVLANLNSLLTFNLCSLNIKCKSCVLKY